MLILPSSFPRTNPPRSDATGPCLPPPRRRPRARVAPPQPPAAQLSSSTASSGTTTRPTYWGPSTVSSNQRPSLTLHWPRRAAPLGRIRWAGSRVCFLLLYLLLKLWFLPSGSGLSLGSSWRIAAMILNCFDWMKYVHVWQHFHSFSVIFSERTEMRSWAKRCLLMIWLWWQIWRKSFVGWYYIFVGWKKLIVNVRTRTCRVVMSCSRSGNVSEITVSLND